MVVVCHDVERIGKLDCDVLKGRVALHDIAERFAEDKFCTRCTVVGLRVLGRDDKGSAGVLDLIDGCRYLIRIGDDDGTAVVRQFVGMGKRLDCGRGTLAVCAVIAGLRVDIEIRGALRCRNAVEYRCRGEQQADRHQCEQEPVTESSGCFSHDFILLSTHVLLWLHFSIRVKPPQRKDFHEIRKFFAVPVFMRVSWYPACHRHRQSAS